MFNKTIKKGFSSLINYFNFVSDGVILNKDGSLTGGFYYQGLDLDSLTSEERNALCSQINAVFAKLDGGWIVNVDSLRLSVNRYPLSFINNSASFHLFEHERKLHFESKGMHYQSIHVLSLTFKPGLLEDKQFRKVFVSGGGEKLSNENDMTELLNTFEKVMDKMHSGLVQAQLNVERMNSENLFSYLHYCVTGDFQDGTKIIGQPQQSPEFIESLDHVIGGYDFIAGLNPQVDGKHIGIVSIIGFPLESYSGILDCLSTLSFPYRSSSRFIVLDPIETQSLLIKVRTKWNNKQFNPLNAVMSLVSPGSESRFGNDEAVLKSLDAQEALTEAQEGLVRYGFYTHSVVLISDDFEECSRNAKSLAHLLKNKGFPSRIESINAVESYLGSHPGNSTANIRKPLIHSFNFAHFFPVNSQWIGEEVSPHPKFPKESPALFCAATTAHAPFFGNIHVEDVGHHVIFGSTGAGKTSLQKFLMASFLRYKDAQIFAFDNQRGFYNLAKSCGADYYEIISLKNQIALCPLQVIESDAEKRWATQWLEDLITLQGVQISPKQRQVISEAVDALRSDKVKSLSNLYANLQDRQLKAALDPFVEIQNGVMAKLLDGSADTLTKSHYQVFEIGDLLGLTPKHIIPVISYLFHRIDSQLDGKPTLIVLSETWKLFNTEYFASKINEWLRQCRAKNASVSFETHSLADINGPLKHVILSNCPTKIFLPNPMAHKYGERDLYKAIGLNDGQIELIANSIQRRHYYWTSPSGNCLIDLELQSAFLSLMGKNTKADIEFVDSLEQEYGCQWPAQYLESDGLKNEARLWKTFDQSDRRGGYGHEQRH